MEMRRQAARRWRKVSNAIRTCNRLGRFTCVRRPRSASYVAITHYDAEAATSFLAANDEHFKGLVREKSLACFHHLGGAATIASRLGSDCERGINPGDLSRSKEEFGENVYPMPGPKSFFAHVRDTFDVFLAALLVCAVVSFAFGVKEHGLKDGWYDGASILLVVLLVSGATAVSCHSQAKRAHRLACESANVSATVVRGGRRQTVPVSDLVVGDVVILEADDEVPADGLCLSAHGQGLHVDESSTTCDPQPIQIDDKKNPFLASGAKVVKGHGTMLVTAVGTDTAWSDLMNTQKEDDSASLLERADGLTSTVANIGGAVAVVTFTVLASAQFATAGGSTGKPQLLDKGLPFAVSLMATFTMRHVVKKNALVHHFSAVETMGSVTAICADKTGALTLKEMKVVEFWVGTVKPRSVRAIADSVVSLLHQGAGLNTTGSVYKPDNVSPVEISGSPTEKALLSWAVADLRMDADQLKRTCKAEVFYSEDTLRSGVITRDKQQGTGAFVEHLKGAAEVVLPKCSMHMDMDGAARELGVERRGKFEKVINDMAAGGLRCIAFAYKQVDGGTEHSEIDEAGLTLLGLVGLNDPCRPEVKAAIKACAKAGIAVKMITCDDNIPASRTIATECGIIISSSNDPDGVIIEGSEFRALPVVRQLEMADNIRVMARSQALDMVVLVKRLKNKGHVVAVAGNGIKDAAALKEADVALCMDAKGAAALAKDSTIILDGKFDTVVTTIWLGRRVYNSIQRVVQFQLTFIVVLTVVSFVTPITTGRLPLTTVEIFMWHLVMVVMNTLAVVADKQPAQALMDDRPPIARVAPLVSNVMWRNMAAQAAFQIGTLLALQYNGRHVFSTDGKTNDTIIFTVFVLCQVFNQLNVRELEKKNIFAGVLRSWIFLVILALTLALLVVTVEVLTRFAGTQRLGLWHWGICVAIAALSLPVGCAAKFIPVPAGRRP